MMQDVPGVLSSTYRGMQSIFGYRQPDLRNIDEFISLEFSHRYGEALRSACVRLSRCDRNLRFRVACCRSNFDISLARVVAHELALPIHDKLRRVSIVLEERRISL